MEIDTAVSRLAALAQDSRLAIFRLLVEHGPAGLPAGEIAARLAIANSALSFHLKTLSHAGLLRPRQEGRYIHYAADFAAMNALLGYLTENCCGGQPCDSACAPAAPPTRRRQTATKG